ncbi:MAG: hypothetical protein HYY76_04905 [Acidobacteria bacterium]|nr:hypothetical protein [Acidobacteriota bacterium]
MRRRAGEKFPFGPNTPGASGAGVALAIVLWHGLFNVLVASEAAAGLIAAVMTTGVMMLALVALAVAGPRELRGLSRRAGPRQNRDEYERLAA